ncbi:MAG: amidohydrolase [Faecousia sp.]
MTELELINQAVARVAEATRALAEQIWQYAELPYEEKKSAAALTEALRREGFSVQSGVAGIPTCFVASCQVGTGGPAFGFLGEYDALSGLSQKAGQASREPVSPGGPGHGCGHNLLGAGCFAAAVAVRDCMKALGLSGKVLYYGCAGEEGAGSKQFMARAGLFDGVDFALSWHPGSLNQIPAKSNVAIFGANFIFDGVAAHAGGSPHLGRSALDAAELMNVGANYLREHMPDNARVHYAYSDPGGSAPNVVPDHTVIKYEVRAPKVEQAKELFARVVDIAKGAALMTQTRMQYEVTMAFSDYAPNRVLAAVVDKCYQALGAPRWTREDYALAADFLHTYPEATRRAAPEESLEPDWERSPLDGLVHPFCPQERGCVCGSTDVGDVSYATPTVMLTTATACLGNVGHSWQNTAQSCSPIGMKGMLQAARVMALSALQILQSPETIAAAKAELLSKNGGAYRCPLPDSVEPPIGRY